MKKRNEGYTLVLVLVVLVILCLMASYLLTFSLRNLHTQKAAALREQHRYAAVGEVETVVGSLQAFAENVPEGVSVAVTADPENGTVLLETQEETPATLAIVGTAKLEADRLRLMLVSSTGTTRIDCTLQLEAAATKNLTKEHFYQLAGLTGVEYVSYDISMVEGGTADE
jgi:competence protein ComGC